MKADMWPILPCTTMSMPFIEMPQREEALPSMSNSPPRPVAPAYWLASPFDMDDARHHVLGDADAGVAVDEHGGVLVHAGAVIADRPVDLDGDRRVDADGDGVVARGIVDDPVPLVGVGAEAMQRSVQLARAA